MCVCVLQFVLEEYTLPDVLNDVTKDDLRCLRLRYRSSRVWQKEAACCLSPQAAVAVVLSSLRRRQTPESKADVSGPSLTRPSRCCFPQGRSPLPRMASHPAAQGEAEEPRQIRGGRMTGRYSWRVARSGCLPLPQSVILKTSVINTCLQTVRIDRGGTLMKHVWPL